MKFIEIFTKNKRLFDRGRVYAGYYQIIGTSLIMMKVFNVSKWYFYIIFIIVVFGVTYLLGYFDDKKVLKEELKQYSEKNPVMMDILAEIKELNEKIEKNNMEGNR